MAFWLFSTDAPIQSITQHEEDIAASLPKMRSRQFRHSRGYARQALSDLWNVPALDIPLKANPGKPPELEEGWGYISFSHCRDALLIGWSQQKLGVDLERTDRAFSASALADRYYSEEENIALVSLQGEALRKAVLDRWLCKEAAIKWQRGSLAEDLVNWCCSSDALLIRHKILGYELSVNRLHCRNWSIAVVAMKSELANSPIICLA